MPAFERLTAIFYDRVTRDPLLAPVFKEMAPGHPTYVAQFIAEVFGGPTLYSEERGGHAAMIRHHLDRHLTERQRARWAQLLGECADEAGLPVDPEFRSAFVAYIEWGTRLAVINSQPGVTVDADGPMPKWGWGEVGGPYQS
jgi:hemoglobin